MMPRSPVLAESRRSVAYAAMVALAFPPCAAMAKSKPQVITSLGNAISYYCLGELGVGSAPAGIHFNLQASHRRTEAGP